MAKIIPFPEQHNNLKICKNCKSKPAVNNLSVCQDCSDNALEILDDYITDLIINVSQFCDSKSIERVLINHIYDLQKGEYDKKF